MICNIIRMFPIKKYSKKKLSKLNLQNFRFKPEELPGNYEVLLPGQSSSVVYAGGYNNSKVISSSGRAKAVFC